MIKIPLIAALGALMIFTVMLYVENMELKEDHMELQQHYDWALELSKMSPQERDGVVEKIHGVPDRPTI